MQPDGNQVAMRVSNSGNGRAQLAKLSIEDATGKNIEINPGLLGYVLPGATMQWTLKIPLNELKNAGKVKVMINGTDTIQDVTLGSSTR